ncbi:MAG TPA: OmpH family outer membrane protein [Chitinophagaceae bacterium]|jgi:outer membrane protein|nr:OmpH family outer membrane protein [Chitinophagaceae bacterium]MBP9740251.1 OmpH family outer membrane protein [Chitinophagaceae bacterium]HPH23981.1 OmpH family outer membrane protein [Chitinophagaceae bacterium]
MKKVLLVAVAVIVGLFTTTKTNAQMKIGTFDEEAILSFMPGIQNVDSLLQKYVTDSLQPEYDYELYQFQTKDSTFKIDSNKLNASVKQIMKKEIAQHFLKIQNWQQYQQQKLQAKQQEFLRPYLEKIYGVLQVVITEQKYTHVFKKDVFIYADKSEELMLRVLLKLKVPLPKEIEEQAKALGIIGGSPATKPAPKKN